MVMPAVPDRLRWRPAPVGGWAPDGGDGDGEECML